MSDPTPYIDITRNGESLTVELTDYIVVPEDAQSGIAGPDITDIIAERADTGEVVELTKEEDKEAATAIYDFITKQREEAETERRIENFRGRYEY